MWAGRGRHPDGDDSPPRAPAPGGETRSGAERVPRGRRLYELAASRTKRPHSPPCGLLPSHRGTFLFIISGRRHRRRDDSFAEEIVSTPKNYSITRECCGECRLSSPVHSFFVCVVFGDEDGLDHGPALSQAASATSSTAVALPMFPCAPLLLLRRQDQEQGHSHPSLLCPVCKAVVRLRCNPGGFVRRENALNDLLSVLAHIGTQHPLLRTSKDVPAPLCPESTHLTLGSPLWNTRRQSGDSDQGAHTIPLRPARDLSPLHLSTGWHPSPAHHLTRHEMVSAPSGMRSGLQIMP